MPSKLPSDQTPVPEAWGLCDSQHDMDTDRKVRGANTDRGLRTTVSRMGTAHGARAIRFSLRAKASIPQPPPLAGEDSLRAVRSLPRRSSAGGQRGQDPDSRLLALRCLLLPPHAAVCSTERGRKERLLVCPSGQSVSLVY